MLLREPADLCRLICKLKLFFTIYLNKNSILLYVFGFSNGDESVIIRLNTVYGHTIGVVSKYININGYADGVQATVSIGYVNDLYNLIINAKKPIMVKIYAGEYSYETVISDLKKHVYRYFENKPIRRI